MPEARLFVFLIWFVGSSLKLGAAANLRLIGGSTSPSGILQIFHNGKWGTICSDGWDMKDTNVACKQLGYSRGLEFASMGEGSGQIWLDNVGCTGSEDSLGNCSHAGWGVHDCDHTKDIGIVCQSGSGPDVSVRLVKGSASRSGRVEVRYYGVWKSICDTNWDKQDANVICRMLGYRRGAAFAIRGYQSSGLVWLSDVGCNGRESSIVNCNNLKWGQAGNCPNNRRAGVLCISGSSNTRFILSERNRPNRHVGRLQVSYYGMLGTVCAENCDLQDAHVVCRTAGYSKALTVYKQTSGMFRFTPGMNCKGLESSIPGCGYQFNDISFCTSKKDAWIVCKPSGSWTTRIRLQGGSSSMEGRVEIQQYGVWGTVCNSGWDIRDANVVCRMLNYKGAIKVYTLVSGGSGPIWLTGLGCKGDEKDILNCTHSGLGQTRSCNHGRDAGVVCHSYSDAVQVRLAGGSFPYDGRVEIKFNDIWGTICLNGWDINDAHVVCRMLNYTRALARIRMFGGGSGKVWLRNVRCTGKEKSIAMCNHDGWDGWGSCGHSADVGVVCQGHEDQNPNVTVRLVPGNAPSQGRVEVRYYGIWGTVCDDGWGLADAHVVCRMLNYSKATSAGTAKVKGSGSILLDEVSCRGNEKSLEHCKHIGWNQHDCSHGEDAGVKCEGLTQEESFVEVRLTGPLPFFGTVEVNYRWTWTPVCDDTWDILDAHVVCRMLGYKAALAGIKRYEASQMEGGWLGGVECSGMEAKISECYHRGWDNKQCNPRFTAAVLCQQLNGSLPVDFRLENGSSPNSGRVAVRYGNVWGTVCNRGLDINDAKVICRMLGYPGASKVYPKSTFGPGNGTIWLSNLECNGTENLIDDCRHPGWGQTTCNHDDDAGVDCRLADAPQFDLNGLKLTKSTVVLMIEAANPIEAVLDSAHQIICEKIKNKDIFSSVDQTKKIRLPSDIQDVASAARNGPSVYITAEVIYSNGSLNFTVGDGLFYNGYHNAPLEPGCAYKVHIRIVTKDSNGRKVYGDSAFVSFTTKPSKTGSTLFQAPGSVVITLSIALVVLIAMIIGYFVRKRRQEKNGSEGKSKEKRSGQDEPLEMTIQTYRDTTRHYQSLHVEESHVQPEQEESYYVNVGADRRQFQAPSTVVAPNIYTLESSLYENVEH